MKEKQWLTKYYTGNKRMSTTNPTKKGGGMNSSASEG